MSVPYHQAKFMLSVASIPQLPADVGAEVAFVGRSNAGKSSALNVLTRQKKLARTSKTPGRTQLLNFFEIDDARRLVDLPGYGFAKVSAKQRQQWQQLISDYLATRQSLACLVLLMDIRHPLKEGDITLLNWASEAEVPIHILLTKCDKLKRGPAKNTLLKVHQQLETAGYECSLQLFSALTSQGLGDLIVTLDEILN